MQIELLPIDEDGNVANCNLLEGMAAEVCQGMAELYRAAGFLPPYVGYLTRRDGQFVGTCACKSPPRQGRVEIAYFTFPEFEGRGIATAMARALIEILTQADASLTIEAQTLPQENASTAVLRKLGFQLIGETHHPTDGLVWQWQRGAATS